MTLRSGRIYQHIKYRTTFLRVVKIIDIGGVQFAFIEKMSLSNRFKPERVMMKPMQIKESYVLCVSNADKLDKTFDLLFDL